MVERGGVGELAARWDARRRADRFVAEPDEHRADDLLQDLLRRSLFPVIFSVIRRKIGVAPRPTFPPYDEQSDAEAVFDDTLSRLLGALQTARRAKKSPDDPRNLAAHLTFQSFAHLLNEKRPERRRLRQRVVYLAKTRPEHFTLERDSSGTLCLGRAGSGRAESGNRASSARWSRVRESPKAVAERVAPGLSPENPAQLHALIVAILDFAGGAAPLEEMVSALATIGGLTETTRVTKQNDDTPDILDAVADERASPAEALEADFLLTRLWRAISELPDRQRVVLLLHLRDDTGRSALENWLRLGTIDEAALADALSMSPDEFGALRESLPCDDKTIALLLKISPENVRYLRHAARQKLAAAMALWDGEPIDSVGKKR